MSSGSDSDSSNGCSARLKASIDPKFNYTQDGKKKEVNKVTTEPLKSLRRSVEDVQPEEVRLNLTKSQQTYVGNLLAGRLDREIELTAISTSENPNINDNGGIRLLSCSESFLETEHHSDEVKPTKRKKNKKDEQVSAKHLKEAAVSVDWILKEAEKLNKPS